MPNDDEADGQVTVEPITVTVSTPDVIALKNLQNYSASELSRIQKRSDKWIAGLVAVTGVLTTAVVIKGPESFTKLADAREVLGLTINPQDWIIGLMLLGGVAIGLGIYWAYSAAYGDPLKDDELAERAKQQEVDGAWAAWTDATQKAAESARSTLGRATGFTIVGTLVLACAVLLTWTTPSKSTPDEFTCFTTGSGTVKIEGPAPVVSQGQLQIVSC